LQEFANKIWKHDAGKALMQAVGFGSPKNLAGADGVVRSLISLRALTSTTAVRKLSPDVTQSLQMKRQEIDAEIIALDGAPSVAAVVRTMSQQHPPEDVRTGVETALTFVGNVLATPNDLRMYRVKKQNPFFQRTLGFLEGSELLMRSIGFFAGTDESIGGGLKEKSLSVAKQQHSGPSIVAYVLQPVGESGFNPKNAIIAEGGGGNVEGIVTEYCDGKFCFLIDPTLCFSVV
jgi:hypothetical protein